MRLTIFSLFFTLSSFAHTSWSDLGRGNHYKLIQEFHLKQNERSGSQLDFMKGESYFLKDITPLDIPGALITLFTFDYKNCPGPDLSTEMELIQVKDTSPLLEIGAQVEKCELNIYLETKDLNFKSIFE